MYTGNSNLRGSVPTEVRTLQTRSESLTEFRHCARRFLEETHVGCDDGDVMTSWSSRTVGSGPTLVQTCNEPTLVYLAVSSSADSATWLDCIAEGGRS